MHFKLISLQLLDKNELEFRVKLVDTTPKCINSYQIGISDSADSWDLLSEPPHTGNNLPLKALSLKTSNEVVKVSSTSPVPSHTCEEGINFLLLASLDGSEGSTTDGNLSSSEDKKELGPMSLDSSLQDDACSCTESLTISLHLLETTKFEEIQSAPKKARPASQTSQQATPKTWPALQKAWPAPQKARPAPPKVQPAPPKAQSASKKAQPAPQKAHPGLKEAPKESIATEDVGYPPPSDPLNVGSIPIPSEEPKSMKDLDTGQSQLPFALKTLVRKYCTIINYRSW